MKTESVIKELTQKKSMPFDMLLLVLFSLLPHGQLLHWQIPILLIGEILSSLVTTIILLMSIPPTTSRRLLVAQCISLSARLRLQASTIIFAISRIGTISHHQTILRFLPLVLVISVATILFRALQRTILHIIA
jgi:hypothetical protein